MRLSAITTAFAASLLISTAAFADDASAPASAPAPTATPTTQAAPAAAPATNEDDTVTCRYEAMTGSNFKKRICHTQREWKQMTSDSRDLMDRIDDHNRMGSGLTGGN